MRKSLTWMVVFVLVGISLPLATANGEIDLYVSHPGNIPNLHNFSTPQLEPGERGAFSFQMTNRYMAVMENVTFTAEIYQWADPSGSVPIESLRSPPRIKEAQGVNEQQMSWALTALAANATSFFGFNVTTGDRTDEGAYFVRFSLEFDYNNTHRVMKSRGHWNAAQWEAATSDAEPGAPGNLNLTRLGVDGIIPDSSFGVHESDELTWKDYLLFKFVGVVFRLGLTALILGVVALIIWVRREKD